MATSHRNINSIVRSCFKISVLLSFIFLLACVSQPTREDSSEKQQLQANINSNSDDYVSILKLADLNTQDYAKTQNKSSKQKAIRGYKKYLEKYPDHDGAAFALYSLILDSAYNENYKKNIDNVREVYSKYPQLKVVGNLPPPKYVDALFMYINARSMSDIDKTRELLKEAIKEKPTHSDSHALLGGIFKEDGRDDLAILSLNQAVSLDSDNYHARRALGELYLYKAFDMKYLCNDKNPYIDKAIDNLKATLGKIEDNYEAHDHLGTLYYVKGQYQLSIFERKAALKIKENNADKIGLIEMYIILGQFDTAEKLSKELIAKDSRFDDPWQMLALIYFYQGKWQESIDADDKFIELADESITYANIRRYLASRELGKNVDANIKIAEANYEKINSEWEIDLMKYYKGKISEDELFSKASNECEKIEADYYVGYKKFLDGDYDIARTFLAEIKESSGYPLFEYSGSKYVLDRIPN